MSEDYKFAINEEETAYEFVLTVEAGKPVEFGVEKFNKGATQGGDFLDTKHFGTLGDANDKFIKAASSTNITCSVAGTYKIVYTIATGTLDFYAVPNA